VNRPRRHGKKERFSLPGIPSANERILAREMVADYRMVESLCVMMPATLGSPEAKRLYARCFHTMQVNMHAISVFGRMRRPHDEIIGIERAIKDRITAASREIGTTIDQLEVICKQRGITPVSRYCEVPLALDVKVISSFGRLYLDLLMLFDQAMVILQSLMLYGILDEQDCHDQKGVFKALVREIARDARRARVALLVDGSLADGTAHSASTPEHDEGAATPGEPGTAGGAETPPADARSVA